MGECDRETTWNHRGSSVVSEPGTLSEQIAASVEDVKALLDDNRSLSIAFLSRRLQDIEKDVRERFRTLDRGRDQRVAALEDAVQKLKGRLQLAGVKFKEMQEELDQMKGVSKTKPN